MDTKYTISKRFHFSASHQLSHLLDPDHPCKRLHGHNYEVELILWSNYLNHDTGFVMDYNDMLSFEHYIKTKLVHRHLNEVLGGSRETTAEMIAQHLFGIARTFFYGYVEAVRVSETPKTWAEFRVIDDGPGK
jgi:6-pyruvoyltetrahydropterin/6-carboxytetrahydropterin synthase